METFLLPFPFKAQIRKHDNWRNDVPAKVPELGRVRCLYVNVLLPETG